MFWTTSIRVRLRSPTERDQADSIYAVSTDVTRRSGATNPVLASVEIANCSSWLKVRSSMGPRIAVTTQSEQPGPRTRQLLQSI